MKEASKQTFGSDLNQNQEYQARPATKKFGDTEHTKTLSHDSVEIQRQLGKPSQLHCPTLSSL